jgi:hypothetical protein
MGHDMDYRLLKYSRQERHDRIQAELRTEAQNRAIIEIVENEPNGVNEGWAYTNIHKTGEAVTIQRTTPSLKQWIVEADGTVTELPTGADGL